MSNNDIATVQAIANIGSVSALVPMVIEKDDARKIRALLLHVVKKISDIHGFEFVSQQKKLLTDNTKTVK